MLFQRLDDLRVDGTPFLGGLFLEILVNRFRETKIEPNYGFREIALSHTPAFYCYGY